MSRVLVIDDSMVVRSFMKQYLEEDGHTVVTADSGSNGLAEISGQPIDLVFLDLLMPELSGLDVLRALADDTAAPPVVVLSADIQRSTREEVMSLGARAFLSKPPTPEEVRSAASEYARSHG